MFRLQIKVGNLYAVFFNEDKRWYRAEICQIPEKDQENPLNTMLDVYFLDFGESVYQKLKFIRILPPQFLELKFQAIECSIANIKPMQEYILFIFSQHIPTINSNYCIETMSGMKKILLHLKNLLVALNGTRYKRVLNIVQKKKIPPLRLFHV